jgi:hypothetical protein
LQIHPEYKVHTGVLRYDCKNKGIPIEKIIKSKDA